MNDKVVMPLWMFGLFIVVMNTTMFNVSIPDIIRDLHISADLGSWIVSGYSIGYALTTVIYSRLSDSVPVRKLVAVGLSILGLSSVLGLFAHSFSLLLAARILQSAGAGVMAGLGLVLVSRYIPSSRRGRAITMITAGSAMAFGFGPIAGGLISKYWGWNGLFGVTCLVLIMIPVLLRFLPKEQPQSASFDSIGALLIVVNTTTLLLAVMKLSFVWLAVSLLSLAAHAWHMRIRKEPFINPKLLRQPGYGKLVAIAFCTGVVNMGNLFLMPLALAQLFSKDAMVIGFMIAPGAILSAALSRSFGKWIDRYGNWKFLMLGHGLIGVVLIVFSLVLSPSPYVIVGGYMLFSSAYSFTTAALNNESTQLLPKTYIGSGMGLQQLIQFFGGSASVAVCGLMLEHMSSLRPAHAYEHVYQLLTAVCGGSFLLLVWYMAGKRNGAVKAQPAQAG
ncbi:MFS transporter [Paenibacillus protaetiae]|uniref:MFS transporter n=1 Tax=Paenibacillus protaetiae TaxID=2509456 RepID=A0A4P6EW78_9BACL|nr:MFS transporter [Paenibacillus protaetiae]QAY67590.1 MFS transporter [Paenibacillus protaetiae]